MANLVDDLLASTANLSDAPSLGEPAPDTGPNLVDSLLDLGPPRPSRAAVEQAVDGNPDEIAKRMRNADVLGVSVEAVSADPTFTEREAKVRTILDKVAEAPATARFLQDPNNAALSIDSVDQMVAAEQAATKLTPAQAMSDKGWVQRLSEAVERGSLLVQTGREGYRTMAGIGDPARLKELQDRQKALGEDLENDFIGWLGSAAQQVGQILETATSTRGLQMVLGGASTGAAMGAAAGAVGGPLAALTAGGGAITGASAGLAAHFARESLEIEGGLSYLEQIEKGIDPNVAKWTGLGVGVINAGLEMAAAKVILDPLTDAAKMAFRNATRKAASLPTVAAAAKRAAGAYAGGIAAEVTTEVLQELVNVAGEEVGKMFTEGETDAFDSDEFVERLGQVMVQTFKSSVFLAAPGPAARFAMERHRIKKAEENQKALDEMVAAITGSPLAERDPQKAGEAMASAMVDNGVTEVFLPAEKIVELARAENVAPYSIFQALDVDTEAAEAAIERGGDVKIDAKVFAERIGMTDAYKVLKDHIRIGEGGLTPAEAKEFAEGTLQEEVAQMEADGAVRLPEIKVEAALTPEETQQLSDAGFKPEEIAALSVEDARGLLADPETQTVEDQNDLTEAVAEAIVGPQSDAVTIAEEQMGMRALFRTADEAGMTQEQYSAYLAALANRTDQAKKAQAMALAQQAKRAATAEWKAERAVVEDEVTQQVMNEPVYQALLGIGRDRLDRAAIEATLPPDAFGAGGLDVWEKKLPKVNGRSIIAAKSETATIDPETYAQLHGFPDATFMLQAFMQAGSAKDAIAARTDAIMLERHGDLNNRMQAAQAAIEHLHNDAGAQVLATELNAVREAAGLGRTNPRLLKQAARDRMKTHRLKDIQPTRYVEAERRAAARAGKLLRGGVRVNSGRVDKRGRPIYEADKSATGAGNRAEAARTKFQQLLNFYYAHFAYGIQRKVQKEEKYLRQFVNENKKWKGVREEYIEAIREILGNFQLGPKLSGAKRDKLMAMAAMDAENGGEIAIPQRVLDADGKTHYSDLTLEQWDELVATVKAIHKQGRDFEKFLNAEENATRTQAVEAVAEAVATNLKNRTVLEPGRYLERLKRFGREASTYLMTDDTIARLIDGTKAQGAAYRYLLRPFNRAFSEGYLPGSIGYKRRADKAGEDLIKLWGRFSRKERKQLEKMHTIPGVARPISRQGIIAVLLNSGNAYNVEAMQKSGQFTAEEIKAIHAAATQKEWDFAQSVWDYLNGFWPEISDATYRRTGSRPQKVEATAIETPYGVYRGGYYPVLYEGKAGKPPTVEEMTAMLKTGGFVASHTSNGHTKDREGPAGNPISLRPHNLNFHVDRVLYDLEVGDAIRDTYRVLEDRRLKKAFRDQGQAHLWDALHMSFGDKVTGEIQRASMAEQTLRWARVGFTVSKLAYNLGTVVLQPLGIVSTMAAIGKRNTMAGLMDYLRNPVKMTKFVTEQTGFMKAREDSFNGDIAQATRMISESWLSKRLPENATTLLARGAFYGMRKLQQTVDTVTWLAAKRRGLQDFDGDEARANEFADRTVARAQGSGNFADRTALERGTVTHNIRQTEFVRAFTPLISYFMAKNNVAIGRFSEFRQNVKGAGGLKLFMESVDLAADMALLFVAEALVLAYLKGQFGDEEDDDKSALAIAAGEIGTSLVAGIPVVRELASIAKGFSAGSPLTSFLTEGVRSIHKLSKIGSEDEDFELRDWKPIVNFLGYTNRIPSAQINRIIELYARGEEEEEIGFFEYVFGPKRLD
jgi:hypothetical protein